VESPAHYDQVLELSVQATRLGNTSFTLATEFRIAARPEIIVTAETVNVVVEAHTLRKTHSIRFPRGARKRRGWRDHGPCGLSGVRRFDELTDSFQ